MLSWDQQPLVDNHWSSEQSENESKMRNGKVKTKDDFSNLNFIIIPVLSILGFCYGRGGCWSASVCLSHFCCCRGCCCEYDVLVFIASQCPSVSSETVGLHRPRRGTVEDVTKEHCPGDWGPFPTPCLEHSILTDDCETKKCPFD